MADLRIGEVASRAGLASSAIRYYESQGLLPRPERRHGQRVYGESVLNQLALIELAKSAGFSVAEIKRLVAGFGRTRPPERRWRELTRAKSEELDRRIAEAQRMKQVLEIVQQCRCPTLEDCGRAIEAKGRRKDDRE